MAFYFPEEHNRIDWSCGYHNCNTELRQVVRDAEIGKRFADALIQVTLLTGAEEWIYIHVEVQGERDADFARRMFTYNYRLYDRFERPIASLAVLADDNAHWRPDRFEVNALGCRHDFEFPVVKLLDYAPMIEVLGKEANPFALVTAAHLRTRQTRHDPDARFQAKLALVRRLYRREWDKQRILDLFAILDWMMRLPDILEQKLWENIELIEGETRMRYVTSVERLATVRGMQQGVQQGVQQGESLIIGRQLSKRFGALPEEVSRRLALATADQLENWAMRVLDAPTLEAVFGEH